MLFIVTNLYTQVGVPSRDVALYTAQQKLKLAKTKKEKVKYSTLVEDLIKVILLSLYPEFYDNTIVFLFCCL